MGEKGGVSFFDFYSDRMAAITFIQKMGRKRIKGTKYNRVTKQQKYVFLKLCIAEKQSIHEAAFNAGIHYSTAKTILFFHKKQYKNYSTYIVDDPHVHAPPNGLVTASWKDIPIDVDAERGEPSRIEIVVNSKKRILEQRMKNKEKGDSTSDCKDSDILPVKLQYEDVDPFLASHHNNLYSRQRHKEGATKVAPLQFPKVESPKSFYY